VPPSQPLVTWSTAGQGVVRVFNRISPVVLYGGSGFMRYIAGAILSPCPSPRNKSCPL
jgi:hypothetical protein